MKDVSDGSEKAFGAWQRFEASGSVADYLSYSAIKHNEETRNEDSDRRDSYQRTDNTGGRQDS